MAVNAKRATGGEASEGGGLSAADDDQDALFSPTELAAAEKFLHALQRWSPGAYEGTALP